MSFIFNGLVSSIEIIEMNPDASIINHSIHPKIQSVLAMLFTVIFPSAIDLNHQGMTLVDQCLANGQAVKNSLLLVNSKLQINRKDKYSVEFYQDGSLLHLPIDPEMSDFLSRFLFKQIPIRQDNRWVV